MADARRLLELGMVGPLAKELAAQITAGVGDKRRLSELGVVTRLASELATQISTPSSANARRLAELSMVPDLAKEVASQIQGSGFRLMNVSARGEIATTRLAAADVNHERITGRTRHVIATECNAIAYTDIGYSVGTAETVIGNDIPVKFATEIPAAPDPAAKAVLYSGSTSGVIPNGTEDYRSDFQQASLFGLSKFAVGTVPWRRYEFTQPTGSFYPQPSSSPAGITGENSYFGPTSSPSQLMNTGSMTTPTSGSSAGYSMVPLSILAYVPTTSISAVGVGDSLLYRSNDVYGDGSAGGGYWRRGLRSVNGKQMAEANFGRGSTTSQNFVDSSSYRRAQFKYHSHGFIQYGTNDKVLNNASPATVMANILTIAGWMKAAGIRHVAVALILPRCNVGGLTSSQTPIAGFATGGVFRDPLNALILAAVGNGIIDEAIDLNPAVADVTFPDRWKDNYSTDGIHPSTGQPSIDMATILNAAAANWV